MSHQARKSQGGNLSAHHEGTAANLKRLQSTRFQHMTFWKGHNYAESKNTGGCHGLGEEGVNRQSTEGFQSCENALNG